jgi:hypothetical protein
LEVGVDRVDLRSDVPPVSGDHLRAQAAYYWNVAEAVKTAAVRLPLLLVAERCENLALAIDEFARSAQLGGEYAVACAAEANRRAERDRLYAAAQAGPDAAGAQVTAIDDPVYGAGTGAAAWSSPRGGG